MFPEMQRNIDLFFSTAMTCIGWIAVVCNLCLAMKVYRLGQTRVIFKTTRYLLFALALPDFGYGLLIGLSGVISLASRRFPGQGSSLLIDGMAFWHGPVCSFSGFLVHLFLFKSVYTMVLIAVSRLLTLIRPRQSLSIATIKKIDIHLWFAGIGYSMVGILQNVYFLMPPGIACFSYHGPVFFAYLSLALISFGCVLSLLLYIRIHLATKNHLQRSMTCSAFQKLDGLISINRHFLIVTLTFQFFWLPVTANWICGLFGLSTAPSLNVHRSYHYLEVFAFLSCTCYTAINPLQSIDWVEKFTKKRQLRRMRLKCLRVKPRVHAVL